MKKGKKFVPTDPLALDKKLSKKEKGKAQRGNPDDWDYHNLQTIIDLYNKAFPGRLAQMSSDYQMEYRLSDRDQYGVVSKDADRRLAMWMPADLEQVISAGYPSLWTDQKHLIWFLRHFPIFRGSEKI